MKINKKYLIISAINALLLILIGVCLFRIHTYSNLLISQQAAEAWAGDSKDRFAQVSCYLPIGSKVDENAVFAFRKSIDKKLAEAGLETKTEGKYWADSYSALSSMKVEGDRGSSDTTAIGVGGDFFLFHPYELRSGSYIYDSDLMKDRVVLDYELAWKLFGGDNLEGLTVKINGKPYYVAGVIQRESDKFSKKTFTGDPMIFMSYSTLAELKEGTSISTYELAMPDPISKFVKNIVTEGFNASKPVVVENSSRYSFINIYNIFKNFGNRSIINNGVVFPYWENAARISEVFIARLYVIIALLAIIPFICFIVLLVKLIKFIIIWIKFICLILWDAWDDRYGRQKARQERKALKQRSEELSASDEQLDLDEESEENTKRIRLTGDKLKLGAFFKTIHSKVKTKFSRKQKAVTVKKRKTTKHQNENFKETENTVYNEKDIAMNIESIVCEILYKSSETENDGKTDIDKTQV